MVKVLLNGQLQIQQPFLVFDMANLHYTQYYGKKIYSYTNIPKENLKFSTGNEVLVPRVGEEPLDFCKCCYLPFKDVAIGEMISVYNTKNNPLFISYMFNATMKYKLLNL